VRGTYSDVSTHHRPVVVTGAAGFIGSNLSDRLIREGRRVIAVDDLSQGVRSQVPLDAEFVELDVRAPELTEVLRGAGAIFHLAAKNCISDCQQDPVAAASHNVTGTVNLLESARQAGVRRVIYAESSALYEGIDTFPTPEDRIAPRSVYAVSKSAGREFAECYARFHDFELTALRYFCVYGPRQDYRRTVPPIMTAFILELLAGRQPTIFGTGEKRRDFVYVDDVNDFHLQCLSDRRTIGGTYNLGSGVDHSVREIYAAIAALLGSPLEPRHAPDLPGEAQRTLADVSRARALGWTPRVGLAEGLRRSIRYIREHVPADAVEVGQ
jgi:nucleoside-diphosphate-sugar epimerase